MLHKVFQKSFFITLLIVSLVGVNAIDSLFESDPPSYNTATNPNALPSYPSAVGISEEQQTRRVDYKETKVVLRVFLILLTLLVITIGLIVYCLPENVILDTIGLFAAALEVVFILICFILYRLNYCR